jgi:hypothetical protein
MYTERNFKTKKELKAAFVAGEKIGVYSPDPFDCPRNGRVGLEGPHHPKPHSWYASVELKDGIIVRILS